LEKAGEHAAIFSLRVECPGGDNLVSDSERNIEVVRSYMKALQDGEAGDSLRRFFTQDVRQIEMPNQLNPRGQESDLEHILQRSLQGLQILKWQSYEVVSEMAHADRVAVEARWTGVLAVVAGTLAAGAEIKASLAMFFRFRDGRIAMQRNYDCFEPW
jgi:ketosteroid isomerase-like protein